MGLEHRSTVFNIADTGGSCGVILCALGGPWLIERGSVEDGMGWEFCFYYVRDRIYPHSAALTLVYLLALHMRQCTAHCFEWYSTSGHPKTPSFNVVCN